MNLDAIKENWWAIALVFGAFIGYVEWRVKETVDVQVGAVNVVSPETVESMKDDIKDNKEYIRKTEDKVERIVTILLED